MLVAQWKQYVIVQLCIKYTSLYLGFHKQEVDTVIQIAGFFENHGFQQSFYETCQANWSLTSSY